MAIKFLNPPPAGAPPGRARQRESGVMAALTHPHVVAIHDCGRADGRDYLVMEYVRGVTLRARLEPGRPWKPADALAILYVNPMAQRLCGFSRRELLRHPSTNCSGPRGRAAWDRTVIRTAPGGCLRRRAATGWTILPWPPSQEGGHCPPQPAKT